MLTAIDAQVRRIVAVNGRASTKMNVNVAVYRCEVGLLSSMGIIGPSAMIFRIMFYLLLFLFAAPLAATARPNVLVIITDDHGHGDLGFHGNPVSYTHLTLPTILRV